MQYIKYPIEKSNKFIQIKHLLYIITPLIFFQNAFVIRFGGGSFKWYELLSLILVCFFISSLNRIKLNKELILLTIIFVFSPLISNILFYVDYSEISKIYYQRFPEAINSLRCNRDFSTFYSVSLSLGCFSVFYFIYNSEYIFRNYEKIIKLFLITGTIVSLYSIYEVFGVYFLKLPDIVPGVFDCRNYSGKVGPRAGGFSIEPGTYVIIQTVVIIYLFFDKKYFTSHKHRICLVLNLIALLLTLSSALLIPIFIICYGTLFFSKNKILKRFLIFLIIAFIVLIPILNTQMNGMLEYVFLTKIKNFVFGVDNTLDSGGMRAYTGKLGINIFKDNILFGCGFGNSFFYMPKYEYSVKITQWGERIIQSTTPQNNFSKILAEQGVFGMVPFILFFINCLLNSFKRKKDLHILALHLIVLSMFLFSFVSGTFITNMFLWFNIMLGLNYMKYSKIENKPYFSKNNICN